MYYRHFFNNYYNADSFGEAIMEKANRMMKLDETEEII